MAGRLRAPKVVENRYALRLRRILQAMHREFERELAIREDAAHPMGNKLATIRALGVRIVGAFRKPVSDAFEDMSQGVQRANRLALAAINPHDLRIGSAIEMYRDMNIALMENAGRTYADQVREILEDPDNNGARVEDLSKQIRERAGVSESRADLIARDQTLKLNGQINKTRQENAGISKYIWNTSHDERVRESHRELDGLTFRWDTPPEPGHPGEDFQCRCIAIPVFDDEDNS